MPGNVSNAAPATVLPASLCIQFLHSREYPVVINEYRNGETQRDRLADTSRKSWRTTRRLSATDLATWKTFFDTRKGPYEPFYFYDHTETVPKYSHDPTGASTYGRYTVRFAGPWEQIIAPARGEISIVLIEIA